MTLKITYNLYSNDVNYLLSNLIQRNILTIIGLVLLIAGGAAYAFFFGLTWKLIPILLVAGVILLQFATFFRIIRSFQGLWTLEIIHPSILCVTHKPCFFSEEIRCIHEVRLDTNYVCIEVAPRTMMSLIPPILIPLSAFAEEDQMKSFCDALKTVSH